MSRPSAGYRLDCVLSEFMAFVTCGHERICWSVFIQSRRDFNELYSRRSDFQDVQGHDRDRWGWVSLDPGRYDEDRKNFGYNIYIAYHSPTLSQADQKKSEPQRTFLYSGMQWSSTIYRTILRLHFRSKSSRYCELILACQHGADVHVMDDADVVSCLYRALL